MVEGDEDAEVPKCSGCCLLDGCVGGCVSPKLKESVKS